MFERVVVLGAGVAGLAATWAAAQRGAQLRLFDGGVGASCLNPGAIDDRPWDEVARSLEVLSQSANAGPLPDAVRVFVDDLGGWDLPVAGRRLKRLCTVSGRVRVARGADRGLLDLSRLSRGARVLVPRVGRAEWNADLLAKGLTHDAFSQSLGIRFEAVDADLLKHAHEDRISPADLALAHDDAERRAWLIERLREMLQRNGRADAILLGPWLGLDTAQAPVVRRELDLDVGEALDQVGTVAGLRYEIARDRLLHSLNVAIEPVMATRVHHDGTELLVELDHGERVVTDAVVLAIGGLVAGGIVYDPPERDASTGLAPTGRAPFRLSMDVPDAVLQARGRPLRVVGSMQGPSLDESAWPIDADPGLLEAVGVRCDNLTLGPQIYAAGDVVADKPRTVLQAVYLGLLAGAAAAGEPGAIAS